MFEGVSCLVRRWGSSGHQGPRCLASSSRAGWRHGSTGRMHLRRRFRHAPLRVAPLRPRSRASPSRAAPGASTLTTSLARRPRRRPSSRSDFPASEPLWSAVGSSRVLCCMYRMAYMPGMHTSICTQVHVYTRARLHTHSSPKASVGWSPTLLRSCRLIPSPRSCCESAGPLRAVRPSNGAHEYSLLRRSRRPGARARHRVRA